MRSSRSQRSTWSSVVRELPRICSNAERFAAALGVAYHDAGSGGLRSACMCARQGFTSQAGRGGTLAAPAGAQSRQPRSCDSASSGHPGPYRGLCLPCEALELRKVLWIGLESRRHVLSVLLLCCDSGGDRGEGASWRCRMPESH